MPIRGRQSVRARGRPIDRQGFALPAVLAVTGVVTLIFLVAITALASLTAEANSARQRVSFLQRALSAEATVAFMAATEPLRVDGVRINGQVDIDELMLEGEERADGELTHLIRTDGRPYQMDMKGPLVLRLQDQAGLINLNQLERDSFDRFLRLLGVNEGQYEVLYARFTDYRDMDQFRQPNGAEQPQYAGARVPNRPLIEPSEFLSILGVADQVDPRNWRRVEPGLVADSSRSIFNMNTATPHALEVRFDLTQSQIERLIAARETLQIRGGIDAETAIGQPLMWDADISYANHSPSLKLSFQDSQSRWVYRSRLTLNPYQPDRAIWIDQPQLLEAPARARTDITDAAQLPYSPY